MVKSENTVYLISTEITIIIITIILYSIHAVPRVVNGEKNSLTAAYAGRNWLSKWVPGAWGYSRVTLPRGL
jgi:hypothetical protein